MHFFAILSVSVVLLATFWEASSLELHFLDSINKNIKNALVKSPLGILKDIGFPREADAPTVATKNGKVKGVIEQSRQGYKFYSYYGIPYAKPPTNSRRFRVIHFLEHQFCTG